MGNYGLEERSSTPKGIVSTLTYLPYYKDRAQLPSETFSSKRETVMSFRTSQKGKYVPDYIADPYYHFLTNGNARTINMQLKEHTYPSTSTSEFLVLPQVKTGKQKSANEKKNPPHVDNGHSFYKTEQSVWTSHPRTDYKINVNYDSSRYFRGGPIVATSAVIDGYNSGRKLFSYSISSPNTFSKISTESTVDHKYYGQKAIGVLAPNRPDISLAAILGELHEGLPSLIGMQALRDRTFSLKTKSKNSFLNTAGSEFLNFNFGIVPLISDMVKVYDALLSASNRLLQYEADAGNGIRRRMSFPIRKKTEVFTTGQLSNQGFVGIDRSIYPSGNFAGSVDNEFVNGTKESFLTQSISEKIWFSGSFTYFIPVGKDLSSNMEKYIAYGSKLFGTSMSVEALWQLSPWSWLLDWFFDIKGTISAFERIQDDNLVINYGYVMATSIKKSTQHTTVTSSQYTNTVKDVMTTVTSVRKERVRANPYGFSAKASLDLNPMQSSILAALGFTKFF